MKYQETEVRVEAGEVVLAGTLSLPATKGLHPAVVLLSGGGPHDRDGSYGAFKPMKMISEHLSLHGLAVLRYDDPGVGDSTGKNVMEYSMSDYESFVSALVDSLMAREDIDAERVGLLGISQGSSLAVQTASHRDGIAFVAILSGHGVTGDELLFEYHRYLGRTAGKSNEEIEQILELQRRINDAARMGTGFKEIEAEARALAKYDFEKLNEGPSSTTFDEYFLSTFMGAILSLAGTPNYREILDYTPLPYLKNLDCPALLLFGDRDEFIDVEVNLGLMKKALLEAGNDSFTTKVLPRANHLFLEEGTSSFEFVPGIPRRDLVMVEIPRRLGAELHQSD